MESETKLCPYCGKEIKAAAKKCRYCGDWLDDDKISQSEQPSNTISDKETHNVVKPNTSGLEEGISELHSNKIGGIIIVSLVVIGIICFLVIKSNSSQSSDGYYDSEAQVAEEITYEYDTAPEEVSVLGNDESGVSPYDDEPDEDDYKASLASMRYSNKYNDVYSADIHLMRADGKKLWYCPWEPETGYSNKLYVYDSETDNTSVVRLNKTSMSDSEMNVYDMVEKNGVITVIMSENRNSNGWVDGTYVWQYNCDTGAWKSIANGCSGAEFINNRTAVKIDNAECINPDAMTIMEMEYRHKYKTIKL